MINKLWIFIIIISIVFSIFTNNMENITTMIIDTPKKVFDIFLNIAVMVLFWSGILEIAKRGGFLKFITKIIRRVIKPLFSGASEESLEYISGNIAANILGLGSAATPFGLKAMEELQKQNKSEYASKNMITLLILNTAGVTLIPTTIISIRRFYGSNIGTNIIPYVMVLSITTLTIALIIDRIFRSKVKCT